MAGSSDRRTLRTALLALGVLALAALLWPSPGAARPDIFSPGDLTTAHAQLSGVKNCTRCHSSGSQLSAERCLDCHRELKDRVAQGLGFHGRLAAAERATCAGCHREHQGRDFALIDWGGPRGQFDHRRAGWTLAGKHRKAECLACHDARRLGAGPVKELAARAGKSTFLGLATRCSSCHFDEHRGQLAAAGGECAQCHTEQAFRPVGGFDHARSAFPLDGKHASVECARCHKTEPDSVTAKGAFPAPAHETFTRFKPVAHADCTACHTDPHQARFGADCTRCHSTAGWQEIKSAGSKATGTTSFHDGTRFPLRGAHAQVKCQTCHGPFPGEKARFKGLAFQRCDDCHLDAHLGQLARKGTSPDCEQCHTGESFTSARFDVEEHARTRYVLEGAHRAVACLSCHLRDEQARTRVPPPLSKELQRKGRPLRVSPAVFREPDQAGLSDCRTCHADVHAGQFEERVRSQGCVACHTVETFHLASFDHDRQTRFRLEGKHAGVACARCHAAEGRLRLKARAPFDGTLVRFRPVESRCDACHAEPHAGQFGASAEGCATCHTPAGWKELRFVHAPPFTQFLLEGKHASLACAGCHATATVAGLEVRRYSGAPITCEGCHVDLHQGAFRRFAQ